MRTRDLLAGIMVLGVTWEAAQAHAPSHHSWGRGGGFGPHPTMSGYYPSYQGGYYSPTHHHYNPAMIPFGVSWGPAYYGPPMVGIMPGFGMPPLPWPGFEPINPNVFVPPPLQPNVPGLAPLRQAARPARPNPTRMGQLVTFGDRLFRAKNYKKATERYQQAIKADSSAAAPRVRLAQIALVHGQFTEAANRLREAQAAQPDWLANATDIEGVYAEPADFHAQIAKLEAHLQAHPKDRDAWLVLGAEWYLSGRTRQAADVFLRLGDRKADPTLAAFLAASSPEALARRQADPPAVKP